MEVISFDVNYRITPGIKDVDSGWGASLNYQSLNQSGARAGILGVGGFYYGRFPRALDRLINKLVVFQWPKWVEVKAAYFPLATCANIAVLTNFNISVLTKVFFDSQIFGTLGIEMRQYNILVFSTDQFGTFVSDQIQPFVGAIVFGAGMNF